MRTNARKQNFFNTFFRVFIKKLRIFGFLIKYCIFGKLSLKIAFFGQKLFRFAEFCLFVTKLTQTLADDIVMVFLRDLCAFGEAWIFLCFLLILCLFELFTCFWLLLMPSCGSLLGVLFSLVVFLLLCVCGRGKFGKHFWNG